MTLNSTIITAAYRESNFTGQAATLTTEEQTEGLQLLQSLVDSFFGLVVGTKAKPWFIPQEYHTSPEAGNFPAAPGDTSFANANAEQYPPPNSRVFLRNTTAETVYMQYKPEDGAFMEFVDAGFTADVTIDGNGMFIGETGVSYIDNMVTGFGGGSRTPRRNYVFRGDIASWVRTDALVYGAENPFPSDIDDFWITALAARLAPRFGNMPNEVTLMRLKDMTVYARGKYRQTEETLGIGPQRTSHSFYNQFHSDDPDAGRI